MIDNNFIQSVLSNHSKENIPNIVSITKLIATYPLNNETAYLYQKIIDTNIPEAIDALFKNRIPEIFFSIIIPDREIITRTISTLVKYKPKEIYEKTILASLGILFETYKKNKQSFNVYKPNFSDIHNISKYLILDDKKTNEMIIDVLQAIWEYDNKNEVAVLCKNIINSYFDNKKNLKDYIPENLLV